MGLSAITFAIFAQSIDCMRFPAQSSYPARPSGISLRFLVGMALLSIMLIFYCLWPPQTSVARHQPARRNMMVK